MEALVNENDGQDAQVQDHDDDVGEEEQEKGIFCRLLCDLEALYLQNEAVVGDVFHQTERTDNRTD